MKKHIIEIIEQLIKENNDNLVTETLTPLGVDYYRVEIEALTSLKKRIENMSECGAYTDLITCDFKEKTMTFEIPEGLQLKSGEYYIEFNK